MFYRLMIAAAALGTAGSAQPSAEPVPPAPPAAPDESRLAAARGMMEALMPLSWMEQTARTAIAQGFLADVPADPRVARRDRHFAERNRLRRAATETEVLRVLRAEGPGLRDAVAEHFARSLSVQDMQAAERFYRSAEGQRLMGETIAMMTDPDYLAAAAAEIVPLRAAAADRAARRMIEEMASLPSAPGTEARDVPVRVEIGPPPVPAAAPTHPAAAADPDRLAAAQRVMQAMWVPEVMNLPTYAGPLLEPLLAMRVDGFGFPVPPEWQLAPDATVSQAAERFDPAFRERARIATRVWAEEINRSNVEAAPIYRRVMAEAYARRFTVAELDGFARFFASPEGSRVMAASAVYGDPEFIAYLARLLPRVLTEIVPAMARIEAATAQLPPPPAPHRERSRRTTR
jgi:hypothetical protein